MASGISLRNRDPNELNDNLRVQFQDVFGEPDSTHSFDVLWFYSNEWYSCMRNLCYTIYTTACGMCIALVWGWWFATITFEHVWCMTPMTRVFSVTIGCFQKSIGICVNCCFAPITATFGEFFSNIYLKNV